MSINGVCNFDYRDVANGLETKGEPPNLHLISARDNMTAFLSQVQESLNKLNNEVDYHRLEDIARYVTSKAPSREKMSIFLKRRQISETIL